MTSEYEIETQSQELTPRLIGTLLWVISTLTSSYPNRTYTIKCHIKTSSLTSLPQNLMRAPYQSNNTSYAKIKQLAIQFQWTITSIRVYNIQSDSVPIALFY